MNILEEIVAYKRRELAEAKGARPLAQLEKALKRRLPGRNFQEAIHHPGRLSLIAEFKRASPSAGQIRREADPVQVAAAYQQAGAQAISVLTDSKFFSGSLEDLTRVKEKVSLPVLRKDFLLEEYQVVEAAEAGADAVLLIAAILPRPVLGRLIETALDLSLDALVEVHTEREMGEALEAEARILGVNNRDLATLQVDLRITGSLIRKIPDDRIRVSESGIHSPGDVEFVRRQGADAVLIGEDLMSAQNVGTRIKEIMNW